MDRKQRIISLLTQAFKPETLELRDDSASHAGHAGAQPGGETHYDVYIVAEAFRGLSRVQRHQAVYKALAGEFAGGLHALSIKAGFPQE